MLLSPFVSENVRLGKVLLGTAGVSAFSSFLVRLEGSSGNLFLRFSLGGLELETCSLLLTRLSSRTSAMDATMTQAQL